MIDPSALSHVEVSLQVTSILFVIGLLFGLILLARRATGGPVSSGAPSQRRLVIFPRRLNTASDDSKSLCVLNRLALTPSHRLHLVRVAGENILLCTHPHGCTVIPASGDETNRAAAQPLVEESRVR